MKRVSSRAIIIEDGKLLTMFRKRIQDGQIKEYYSLPGGGVNENESLEDAAIRELREEFNIEIKILGYLGKVENDSRIEYFYACQRVSGTPILGGEEKEKNSEENHYEFRYLDINDLDNVDIYNKDLIKKAIKKEYK